MNPAKLLPLMLLLSSPVLADRVLNTELALVVRNAPLATEMRSLMDSHLEKSARIDARGFPAGSTERYPGVPRWKVWKLRLFRLLAPLVRGQL